MKKHNNYPIVKSSIEKEVYNNSFVIRKDNEVILIIKAISYREYSELSFEIFNIYQSWLARKLIKETIDSIEGRIKLTETINREYYLRVWLKYLGFKERVFIPDYFKLNNKKYHYIVSAYR
ncbi:hypothetical protein K1I87_05020 [Streptococcus gordonii]|uniref:hypothetical protein n=1 Tax=Streptococcus gordonii TaxID=1302 RepID=UPI001CC0E3B5|nr:hypothetical protein [Streptococcus gordonii]MBZ2135561.1 hypothetical protein [Streptococcus gordonii]